jgi:hypothetical protein
MIALMVPKIGLPFIEHVPDGKRGETIDLACRLGRDDSLSSAALPDWQHTTEFVKISFVWRTTIYRGIFSRELDNVVIDIFEEV